MQGPCSTRPCSAVWALWRVGLEMTLLTWTPPQQGFPFSTQRWLHFLKVPRRGTPRKAPGSHRIHVFPSRTWRDSGGPSISHQGSPNTPSLGIQGWLLLPPVPWARFGSCHLELGHPSPHTGRPCTEDAWFDSRWRTPWTFHLRGPQCIMNTTKFFVVPHLLWPSCVLTSEAALRSHLPDVQLKPEVPRAPSEGSVPSQVQKPKPMDSAPTDTGPSTPTPSPAAPASTWDDTSGHTSHLHRTLRNSLVLTLSYFSCTMIALSHTLKKYLMVVETDVERFLGQAGHCRWDLLLGWKDVEPNNESWTRVIPCHLHQWCSCR